MAKTTRAALSASALWILGACSHEAPRVSVVAAPAPFSAWRTAPGEPVPPFVGGSAPGPAAGALPPLTNVFNCTAPLAAGPPPSPGASPACRPRPPRRPPPPPPQVWPAPWAYPSPPWLPYPFAPPCSNCLPRTRCAPCDGGEAKRPGPDPAQINLLALLEEIRADHRRWAASREDKRTQVTGESVPPPPDTLDVRLWPAVTFTGPPAWVGGTLALAVAVVIGLAVTTWKVAIKRIELLRGIWADSKEVNEWRGKLGSAIAGVTKLALWAPALVVAVVLLTAVVAYRGTSCEASGCAAVTPSVPAAPQGPVVVYVPAPSAPGDPPSSPTSTSDARSDAVRWQSQAEEWRREAAAARNELAGLRRGDADSAGAAHVWIAALSFLVGAAAGGLATWLFADRLNRRPRTEPDRDREVARPPTTAARTRAVATYDDLKSVEPAEDLRLLGLRAALWREQIASAWKRLEESLNSQPVSLNSQPASGKSQQPPLPSWLAGLQGHASLLQRRVQEVVDFTSRPDDGEA